ncbi:unnamed protein product [Lampetra fluviatilis]
MLLPSVSRRLSARGLQRSSSETPRGLQATTAAVRAARSPLCRGHEDDDDDAATPPRGVPGEDETRGHCSLRAPSEEEGGGLFQGDRGARRSSSFAAKRLLVAPGREAGRVPRSPLLGGPTRGAVAPRARRADGRTESVAFVLRRASPLPCPGAK